MCKVIFTGPSQLLTKLTNEDVGNMLLFRS